MKEKDDELKVSETVSVFMITENYPDIQISFVSSMNFAIMYSEFVCPNLVWLER